MTDRFEGGPRRISFSLIFNLLTVLVLLATLGVGVALGALLLNPYLPYNPYPPPTLPPTLGFPTATNTPEIFLPPTWTPTITNTPGPTRTPTVSPSPSVVPVTLTPDLTEEAGERPKIFVVQNGNPALIPNSVNGLNCEWMGVAGQVFSNNQSAPILNLTIHLEGVLNGETIVQESVTGSAPTVGPGGYLLNLATRPIASQGTLWVQVRDNAGVELSEIVFFNTSDACSENQILINWSQIPEPTP